MHASNRSEVVAVRVDRGVELRGDVSKASITLELAPENDIVDYCAVNRCVGVEVEVNTKGGLYTSVYQRAKTSLYCLA
jgi:hypothetical protein